MPSSDLSIQLPAVDPAALPREVREGGAEARKLYSVALGFERMLISKLTEELANSTSALGEEDQEGGFGSSNNVLKEQLPGTLADGLIASGGIGLALDLYRDLKVGLTPETTDATTVTPEPAQPGTDTLT
jgi:hypothetical protein